MALVRVRWEVTETHEAEIEIDGFSEDDTAGEIDDGLLADHENDESFEAAVDRGVLEYKIVRSGDAPEVAEQVSGIRAPQHEPMWDD